MAIKMLGVTEYWRMLRFIGFIDENFVKIDEVCVLLFGITDLTLTTGILLPLKFALSEDPLFLCVELRKN